MNNISYRNQGYAEGLAKNNAYISYHSHKTNCRCTGSYYYTGQSANISPGEGIDGQYKYFYSCNKCGGVGFHIAFPPVNAGTLHGSCSAYVCGKTTSTIESVTINGVVYK